MVRSVLGRLAAVMRVTQVILLVLALTVALGDWRASKVGDRLQIALPLLALACQPSPFAAQEFVLRYGAMFTAAHGTKRALDGTEINRRPDGGASGFPSAHTSTAVLGASALLRDCLVRAPVAQGVAIFAATFVGASRIDAGRHDIWQVFAGALLGLGSDRLLRRDGPARARAVDMVCAARNAAVRFLRHLCTAGLAAPGRLAAAWRSRRLRGAGKAGA
ncbi:phosphatase PAP2 family protein [Frigidibacter sp. MR17.14]|uniref:phosphatase PAP2 family protein n=1 Tax=Frigidibacter sp. MR17.14 TaxID=3126509 RepID=UPI003012D907